MKKYIAKKLCNLYIVGIEHTSKIIGCCDVLKWSDIWCKQQRSKNLSSWYTVVNWFLNDEENPAMFTVWVRPRLTQL